METGLGVEIPFLSNGGQLQQLNQSIQSLNSKKL